VLRKLWIFAGIVLALIALWTLFALTWARKLPRLGHSE